MRRWKWYYRWINNNVTLEEAEKEVFNNKKNEPDSLFSDYGQTENAFGGESLFEDTGPTVSVFNTDTSGYLPAVGGFLSNGAYAWYSNIGGREVNEDCVKSGTFKDNFIAVVADGLGGEVVVAVEQVERALPLDRPALARIARVRESRKLLIEQELRGHARRARGIAR